MPDPLATAPRNIRPPGTVNNLQSRITAYAREHGVSVSRMNQRILTEVTFGVLVMSTDERLKLDLPRLRSVVVEEFSRRSDHKLWPPVFTLPDAIPSGRTPKREEAISNHPCLKPQHFMRIIVRALLPLGEGRVLDPFMGSGSTIAAAKAVCYRA